MIALLLALALLLSPARAGWCSGIIAENGDCLVTEPPVILRCDYYDARRGNPKCVGVIDHRRIYDADATMTPEPAPRRRREKR
jgi:hypothetical protein